MTERVGFGKNGAFFSSLAAGSYYGPSATDVKSGNLVVAESETLFLTATNMIPGDTIELMQVVDGLAMPYFPLPKVRLILKDTVTTIAVGFPGTYCMVMSAPALGRVGVEVTIECHGHYGAWLAAYKECWNRAPIPLSSPDRFEQLGDAVSYDLSTCFFDTDGDALTYSMVGEVPTGIAIDPVTGIISGTPAANGKFNITVLADDGNGGLATCPFLLDVNAPPVAPANAPFTSLCVETFTIADRLGVFTDADNDKIALSASGLPAGITFTDNGDGSYTLGGTCPTGGIYNYDITATDGRGGSATVSANIIDVDSIPLVPAGGPFSDPCQEGDPINFTNGAFTDPDSDPLTLTESGLPAGVVFTDNGNGTYTLTGTCPSGGTYQYSVTADDGRGATITQAANSIIANSPPVCPANITAPGAEAGAAYGYTTNPPVTDPNGDPVSLSFAGVPAGLTMNDNGDGTGVILGTPTTPGAAVVTVTADDGNGANCVFTVSFIIGAASTALTCPVPATVNVAAGATVNYTTPAASDSGGGAITLAASNVPATLAFTDNGNGTGTVTGTMTEPDGTYIMSVQASGGTPAQNCFITVNFVVAATALPPSCPANGNTGVTAGDPLSANVGTVTDPASGAITLTAGGAPGVPLPPGATFTDNGDGTGTFGGSIALPGVYNITIEASSAGGTCTFTHIIAVTLPGNSAPSCPTDQTVSGVAGAALVYTTTPAVTDSDGDPISLVAVGVPGGVTFTDNSDGTGTFGGTFTAGGNDIVTITASDGQGGSCSFTLTIESVAAGNVAPVCPVNQAIAGIDGDVLAFTTPAVTDADLDPISISASGLPASVTFTDNGDGTGTFGGVFPAAGADTVTLTSSDGQGGSCTFDVVITTSAPANIPPVCPINQAVSITDGDTISFTTPAVTDPDSDPISLGASGVPAGVTFADNGDGTGTFGGTIAAGTSVTITVNAGDGQGGSCSFDVVITSVGALAGLVSNNIAEYSGDDFGFGGGASHGLNLSIGAAGASFDHSPNLIGFATLIIPGGNGLAQSGAGGSTDNATVLPDNAAQVQDWKVDYTVLNQDAGTTFSASVASGVYTTSSISLVLNNNGLVGSTRLVSVSATYTYRWTDGSTTSWSTLHRVTTN